jgi:hypothetical protein
LNPKPESRDPHPGIRYLKPRTVHQKPETLNPKPYAQGAHGLPTASAAAWQADSDQRPPLLSEYFTLLATIQKLEPTWQKAFDKIQEVFRLNRATILGGRVSCSSCKRPECLSLTSSMPWKYGVPPVGNCDIHCVDIINSSLEDGTFFEGATVSGACAVVTEHSEDVVALDTEGLGTLLNRAKLEGYLRTNEAGGIDVDISQFKESRLALSVTYRTIYEAAKRGHTIIACVNHDNFHFTVVETRKPQPWTLHPRP